MARFSDADVQKILHGRRKPTFVTFPGSDDIEVGLKVLSDTEIDDARANAQHYCSKRAGKVQIDYVKFVDVDPEQLSREHMRQMIALAYVDPTSDPQSPKPFFENADQVREFDSVLVQHLYDLYEDNQEQHSPHRTLDQEGLRELAELIKKEPGQPVILANLSQRTLIDLVLFTAAPPPSSTPTKSSTSPTASDPSPQATPSPNSQE